MIASRRDVGRVELWAIVYFLPRPRTEMATLLDDIGEVPLLLLEDARAEPEDQGGRRRRIGQRRRKGRVPSPSSDQRKASSRPLSGLTKKTHWYFFGTIKVDHATGLTNMPNCRNVGMMWPMSRYLTISAAAIRPIPRAINSRIASQTGSSSRLGRARPDRGPAKRTSAPA